MNRRLGRTYDSEDDEDESLEEEPQETPKQREQSAQTLAAEGDVMAKAGHYKRAIDQYTQALEKKGSNDKNILVARSRCYVQLGDSEKALADVDLALTEDKSFYKGLYQKAEALFSSGDFEYALIYYHRGHKLRPDLVDFRLGIQKAQQAIDESIDTGTSISPRSKNAQFAEHPSQINLHDSQVNHELSGTLTSMPNHHHHLLHHHEDDNGKKQSTTRTLTQATSKELLGELSLDQEYLEDLLKDDSLDANEEMSTLVSDGLKYLDTRREFWRQQRPPTKTKKVGSSSSSSNPSGSSSSTSASHTIKQRITPRVTNSSAINSSSTAAANSNKKSTTSKTGTGGKKKKSGSSTGAGSSTAARQKYVEQSRYAIQSLQNINDAIDRGEPELGLKFAKTFLQRLTALDIPDKEKITGNLYHSMGNIYIDLGKLSLAAIHHRKDLDIAMSNNFKESYLRALGALGRTYQKMSDHPEAIKVWEKKLELSPEEETVWLAASIGHSYYCLGEYEDAIKWESKAINSLKGQDDTDQKIHLKSLFIIGNAHFKLGQYKEAIQRLKEHVNLAKELDDSSAQAQGLHQLGNVYLVSGNSAQSIECQTKAAQISKAQIKASSSKKKTRGVKTNSNKNKTVVTA